MMTNNAALLSALKILWAEKIIIRSHFNKKQQDLLNEFSKQTGIIQCQKQGSGFIYTVVNKTALESYLKNAQPLSESELSSDLPIRSRNIGLYKNSKQINPQHEVYYLLLKAVGNDVFWHNCNHQINISEQTQLQGVSSLMIEAGDNWQSDMALFLVENQALFNRLDWLPANFNGTVLYYSGQLSNILLNWLSYKNRVPKIILMADYDGVGLNNFSRLCNALGNQSDCYFYLMPNWQEKLNKFGNVEIWQKNQTLFYNSVQRLREIDALNDELNELIKTMPILGKGLEQEAIWL